MKIQHIHGLPPLYTNTFLITTDAGHGILIDAAAAPETYLDALKAENATLTHILLTHGHYDHVGAVAEIAAETDCKVFISAADLSLPPMITNGKLYYTDTYPASGSVAAAGLTFRVIPTPGHTPGSVCLVCGDVMFSGDTLFCGSCGRTDLPGGNSRDILASLKTLAALPGNYRVCPGHGSSTDLAWERETNPYMGTH